MNGAASSVDERSTEPIGVDDWLDQAITITAEIYGPEPPTMPQVIEEPDSADDAATEEADRRDPDTDPQDETEEKSAVDLRDGDQDDAATVVADPERTISDRSTGTTGAEATAAVQAEATPGDQPETKITPGDQPETKITPGDETESSRLRRFITSALALALGLVVLGGGTGYLVAKNLPDRWRAEAEVVIDPGDAQVDRHLATQQVLMESSIVLDSAVDELPVDRDYVEKRLEVFPIEASNALGITFEDENPMLARSVVAAVLGSFMVEVDTTSTEVGRPIYEKRIEEFEQQRQQLELRLQGLELANAQAEAAEEAQPYPGEVRRLSLESEQLLARINGLKELLLVDEVATMERTDALVVTQPRVLSEPAWPNPLAFAALGLLVGSVAAAAVLFLLASRRAR